MEINEHADEHRAAIREMNKIIRDRNADAVPATHGDLNMIVAVMEDMTSVQTVAREKIVEHNTALMIALREIRQLQVTCGRLAQAVAELEERERNRS